MKLSLTCEGVLNPDDLSLAFKTRFGSDIKYHDDGFGPLWIFRDTGGVRGIVRAQKWEDAYSCINDEILNPIAADDLPDAYGFDNQTDLDAALATAKETEQWPELAEGYEYQDNATGTGIVAHDLNGEALDLLTVALLEELEIELVVKM